MSMNDFLKAMKSSNGDEEGILDTLFECYNPQSKPESEEIRRGFETLYGTMNDKSIWEQQLDVICDLCGAYEKAGFIKGVRVGIRLMLELGNGYE